MNNSVQRRILLTLLLIPSAGWSTSDATDECLFTSKQPNAALIPRETLGVAIDLPIDAKGPITSMDSGDYLWQTSEGDIRVLFNKDPLDWPNTKPLNLGTNQSIKFFRWKDYSKKDVLLGYVPRNKTQDRSSIVEVPVDWNSCASVARAAQIARSARLINDPSKLRVTNVEQIGSSLVATVVNELGEKKLVRDGDVLTRDAGRVKSISKEQVLIEEYVWGSGWRTMALKFEK